MQENICIIYRDVRETRAFENHGRGIGSQNENYSLMFLHKEAHQLLNAKLAGILELVNYILE